MQTTFPKLHIYMVVTRRENYRLSPSYTNPANPYLITNAITLPATWVAHKTFTSRFSVIGPSLTKNQFKMVRFVASKI